MSDACNNIYLYNKNSIIRNKVIDHEYANGKIISYLKEKARLNLSYYELLKDEFEKCFRKNIEQKYLNFDIDMYNFNKEISNNKHNKL